MRFRQASGGRRERLRNPLSVRDSCLVIFALKAEDTTPRGVQTFVECVVMFARFALNLRLGGPQTLGKVVGAGVSVVRAFRTRHHQPGKASASKRHGQWVGLCSGNQPLGECRAVISGDMRERIVDDLRRRHLVLQGVEALVHARTGSRQIAFDLICFGKVIGHQICSLTRCAS